jgi:hypothetical protein
LVFIKSRSVTLILGGCIFWPGPAYILLSESAEGACFTSSFTVIPSILAKAGRLLHLEIGPEIEDDPVLIVKVIQTHDPAGLPYRSSLCRSERMTVACSGCCFILRFFRRLAG